jgi:hypothetical protein
MPQMIPANWPTCGYVIAVISGTIRMHRLIYKHDISSFYSLFLFKNIIIYYLKHAKISVVAAKS